VSKGKSKKLEKEIYSKIPLEDFEYLEKYVKLLYNKGLITQPTVSSIVRHIVREWIISRRKEDGTYFSPFQGNPHSRGNFYD
jgi:hypothetical protein